MVLSAPGIAAVFIESTRVPLELIRLGEDVISTAVWYHRDLQDESDRNNFYPRGRSGEVEAESGSLSNSEGLL
jgi:hypothetical protein